MNKNQSAKEQQTITYKNDFVFYFVTDSGGAFDDCIMDRFKEASKASHWIN